VDREKTWKLLACAENVHNQKNLCGFRACFYVSLDDEPMNTRNKDANIPNDIIIPAIMQNQFVN
jgi:hypothetical protein